MEGAFRVIIVGGGPVGLLAAHCLSKAGIDFILLERGETLVPDSGASIGVYPSTIRIFDQLGLLGALQEIWSPLQRKIVITHNGVVYKDHPRFSWMKANHGHPFAMFHRAELLECLYENLPEAHKNLVFTKKHVLNICRHDDGLEVRCSDDTVEYGSIVIGADGAYSKVRQCMRELMEICTPQLPLNAEKPYCASHRLLYGTASLLPGIEQESSWETHGTNMSTQLYIGRDKMWFFWYDLLGSTTQEKTAFTSEDQESFVKKWGHIRVTDKIQLADIYAARLSSGMTLLKQGMVDNWSWGRIVLVGDAAVKMTTNMAFGFNGGVQGLVALMNNLHALVSTKDSCSSSTENIVQSFRAYQAVTMPLLARLLTASSDSMNMSVWHTWWDWVMDRYVTGATNTDWKNYHQTIGPTLSEAHVLDYLEENNLPASKFQWTRHPKVGKSSL